MKQKMCTTCVTAKEKTAKKNNCIFHYCSKQMLEFLLKTFKTKKFTGVNRRHRRVNMQKKETDGSSELFYGFALHR